MLEPLTESAYRIDLGVVNAYLVDDGSVTLVDAGTPFRVTTLRRALAAAGYAPSDLDRVVLTHYDFDHVGGLAGLGFDGPIFVGAPDAGFVAGTERPPLGNHKGLLQRLLDPLLDRPSGRIEPLEDGQQVGAFTAVRTPGHTPGHTVYVHESLGICFLGDLARARQGRLTPMPLLLAYSGRENARSIQAFVAQEFDCRIVAPGHGDPITDGGAAALTELAQGL